jgi:hypothetical protein
MNKGISGAALEKALAAKLQELLRRVPWLGNWKIEQNPAPFERAFDLLAIANFPHGPEIQLWIDCRAEPRPSLFPYVAIEREFEGNSTKRVRLRVFAAPHISDRMAEVCERHGWSWFDLAGNCRLSVPRIFHIERRGNEPVHRRSRPAANLSTPQAGRVIRALLAPENSGLHWTQRTMQTECHPNVSLGLVNKVIRHLRDEAFVEVEADGGFRLLDPLKLLFSWRDAYRFNRHERRNYFTLLQGKALRDALARLGARTGGFAAYAAFSAADFQAPHVRQPKTWIYVREKEVSKFERVVEAKAVDSGENVILLIPDDDGVFNLGDGGRMGDNRLACTNAVQTYVDLWHCGGRGHEAAEALLEQKLRPAWKRAAMSV